MTIMLAKCTLRCMSLIIPWRVFVCTCSHMLWFVMRTINFPHKKPDQSKCPLCVCSVHSDPCLLLFRTRGVCMCACVHVPPRCLRTIYCTFLKKPDQSICPVCARSAVYACAYSRCMYLIIPWCVCVFFTAFFQLFLNGL